MPKSLAAQWAALEEHFQRHARLVARFRETGRDEVLAMWEKGINEGGTLLSQFEREALIERYCELFGTWPACPEHPAAGKTPTFADLELADSPTAEEQRIARQRRAAIRERLGGDIRLSERVLLNFEATFQLMVGYPRALTRKSPDWERT